MPINFGLTVNCRRLWLIARSHYVTVIKMYEYCVLCYIVLKCTLMALMPLFSWDTITDYQRLSLYMRCIWVYDSLYYSYEKIGIAGTGTAHSFWKTMQFCIHTLTLTLFLQIYIRHAMNISWLDLLPLLSKTSTLLQFRVNFQWTQKSLHIILNNFNHNIIVTINHLCSL